MTANQQTAAASLQAAEVARQGTIAASSTHVGYWSGKGGSGEAAYQSAVVTANNKLQDDRIAAERARQASVSNAHDLLRSQNEL